MKRLTFLIIFLPLIAVSQDNLKKSAEDFIAGYFKMFEDKKWDEILNSCSEDGFIIWPNHGVSSLTATMKSVVDRNKTEMTSDKIDVKWIYADVMRPASAMVTASYLETTNRSGNIRVTDNLDVYLLELKEGSWKIKKGIPQDNYPLVYGEQVEKKFQTGRMGPLPRFDGAFVQTGFMWMCLIEFFKERGVSPAEVGKMVGMRDAKIDHETGGFGGVISAFLYGIQTLSTYTEVIERNDKTLKLRFIPFSIPDDWNSTATNEDMRMVMRKLVEESAQSMGGRCSLEQDGKFCILTLNRE